MAKILALVEGPTEEAFIKQILNPYLEAKPLYIQPVIITTKIVKSGPNFRGGYVTYANFKAQVQRLLGDSSAAMITTMLDLSGLSDTFPGYAQMPSQTGITQAEHLEQALSAEFSDRRFRPYLSVYEFEALLFSEPGKIEQRFSSGPQISRIRSEFVSPEDINHENPPGRHLTSLFSNYKKTIDGIALCKAIGLSTMREHCKHFNLWVSAMEAITP
jgi:hypothetical protein